MLTLLSLSLMTVAVADTPTSSPPPAAALCFASIPPPVRVSLGRVTIDGDDLQQYAMVEDDQDFYALVPGSRRGFLGGNGPGDVAIMLDGVVLLNNKRLGPLP